VTGPFPVSDQDTLVGGGPLTGRYFQLGPGSVVGVGNGLLPAGYLITGPASYRGAWRCLGLSQVR
jgi:hypothetical protein